MDENVQKLKKNFESQLEQVGKQIDATRAQLDQLMTMREQLKGAVFALNAVSAVPPQAPAPAPEEKKAEEPAPEAPAEEKKEG